VRKREEPPTMTTDKVSIHCSEDIAIVNPRALRNTIGDMRSLNGMEMTKANRVEPKSHYLVY
jgi:hypothetical protein